MTTVQCKPSKGQVPFETIVHIFTTTKKTHKTEFLWLVALCVEAAKCYCKHNVSLKTVTIQGERRKKNSPLGHKFFVFQVQKRTGKSWEREHGGVAKPRKKEKKKKELVKTNNNKKLLSKSFLLTRIDLLLKSNVWLKQVWHSGTSLCDLGSSQKQSSLSLVWRNYKMLHWNTLKYVLITDPTRTRSDETQLTRRCCSSRGPHYYGWN